jgi:hypothetical protein
VLLVQHDQAGFDLKFDMMKFKAVNTAVKSITDSQLKGAVNSTTLAPSISKQEMRWAHLYFLYLY